MLTIYLWVNTKSTYKSVTPNYTFEKQKIDDKMKREIHPSLRQQTEMDYEEN